MTETCPCGCGALATVSAEAACRCGCECCRPAQTREEEIAQLHRLLGSIQERLEELGAR
jgi:hypothetical protein